MARRTLPVLLRFALTQSGISVTEVLPVPRYGVPLPARGAIWASEVRSKISSVECRFHALTKTLETGSLSAD